MGKSKRKNKEKKSDFKKVKLKVGKKLKKTQDTDTAFKAKQVILTEQLGRRGRDESSASAALAESESFIGGKQSIPELCQHLRHYRKNARREALLGLKQAIGKNPDSVSSHLGVLLPGLGAMTLEDDSGLRQLVAPLIKSVVERCSGEQLRPHFRLFVAHLSCALTHLQTPVKLNALKCLESLILIRPELCRSDRDLFHSFLEALPALGHSSVSAPGLTNAQQPLFSQAKKSQILHHLEIYIGAISGPEEQSVEKSANGKMVSLKENGTVNVSLLESSVGGGAPFDFPFIYTGVWSTDQESILDVEEELMFAARKVLPFLHGIWVEVTSCEDQMSTMELKEEDLATLVVVLNIQLKLLSSNGKFRNLSENYRQELAQLLTPKSFLIAYEKVFPLEGAQGTPKKQLRIANSLLCDFIVLCLSLSSKKSKRKFLEKCSAFKESDNYLNKLGK